jgi:WD40 repeat protein/DNA-directed RNA polymerase specialized sigma24 family protein
MPARVPNLLRLALAARSDGDLLRAHLAGTPTAFTELTRRHAELARRVAAEVCPAAADDVAQATLTLLARKAGIVVDRESAAGWVFETARRLALKARTAAARRSAHEGRAEPAEPPPEPLDTITLREIRAAVAEEVARLPDELRLPLVVCYWDGASRPDAAVRLGCSVSTLKRRLDDGRDRLAARLARRGFAGPAVLAALAAVQAGTVAAAVRPTKVLSWKLLSAAMVAVGIAAVGLGVGTSGPGAADPPGKAAEPAAKGAGPAVDRYGDPLPKGAVMRLGTVRFRHGGQVHSVAYSADGKTLASGGYGKIMLWEADTGKPLGKIVRVDEFPGKTPSKVTKHGHTFGLAFTPDGRWLVAGGSPGNDREGHVLFWDRKAGQMGPVTEIHDAGHHWVRSVALSPDGKTAAFGTDGGKVMLFDVKTQEVTNLPADGRGASGLSFAPNGKTLAVATYEDVRLFDLATRQQTKRIQPGKARLVVYAPDGKSLWIGLDGVIKRKDDMKPGSVVRWDLAADKAVETREAPPGMLLAMAVSPDGKEVVVGGEFFGPLRWAPASGKRIHMYSPFTKVQPWVHGLAFSPDGKTLASADTNDRVRVFDTATWKELHLNDEHTSSLTDAAVSPDGTRIATTGGDGFVRIWDLATGKVLKSWLADDQRSVFTAAFTPDGRHLLTSGWTGKVRLWDPTTGTELRQFGDRSDFARTALSPDGKLIAASGKDGMSIVLYDAATGQKVRDIGGHASHLAWLRFTPDGRRLVSSADMHSDGRTHFDDRTVRVWDVATGTQVHKFDAGRPHGGATISPDGRVLVAAAYLENEKAGYLRFWDLAGGTEITDRRSKDFGQAEFSPDGRYLAAADHDIRLIELATGRVVQTFESGAGSVTGLTFTPDGRRLVSAHDDGTALVWDLTPPPLTGRTVAQLWDDLASEDGAVARRAVFALAADPGAVRLIGDKLKPTPKPAGWRPTAALLVDLDDPMFRVREAASRALVDRVATEFADLAAAQEAAKSAEVKERLGDVLKAAPGPWPKRGPEDLRRARALGVLEMVGTAEARELGKTLTGR